MPAQNHIFNLFSHSENSTDLSFWNIHRMKVYYSPDVFESEKPVVATMGTFDGVHLGHQTILKRLKESARELQGESVVVTFHPHPRLVLSPQDGSIQLLQTLEERIVSMQALGIDKLVVIPFTLEFSNWSSEKFIQNILVSRLKIRHLIIGYDHQFGKDRNGGLSELRQAGPANHFTVEEIPAHLIQDNAISSTRIRKALECGNLKAAYEGLGYSYELTGRVVHGDHRGRTIGFPTANVELLSELKLIPANGVYAVEVIFLNQKFQGMLNIGLKPTFGENKRTIEVHLFNFNLNMYDEQLCIRFKHRIRDEQKFNSVEELKAQLRQDQETCFRLLS
jgi:riboflavin kinase/FMN adenylyltransferase